MYVRPYGAFISPGAHTLQLCMHIWRYLSHYKYVRTYGAFYLERLPVILHHTDIAVVLKQPLRDEGVSRSPTDIIGIHG